MPIHEDYVPGGGLGWVGYMYKDAVSDCKPGPGIVLDFSGGLLLRMLIWLHWLG
jgi:hypothetical protein